jgi:endonuclease YncB( thermonuclease family)
MPQCRRNPAFALMPMRSLRQGVCVVAIACAFVVNNRACAMAQEQTPPCGGDEVAPIRVAKVSDGRTFTLADNREVRLAAIEVPLLPPVQQSKRSNLPPAAAAGAVAAKNALAALVGGGAVMLRRADIASDRYGRIVAYAYMKRDGREVFVQGEMIAAGLARVGDDVASTGCAAALLARENAARKAKLGLWANPYYDPIDADTPADVLEHKGQFALVEGQVVSVHRSGSTIYLNFGRHWSEDFAVTVRKRNERSFAAAGLDLQGLAGRRVIVRGFVEARGRRGSPAVEATRPEQIETADQN